MLYNHFGIKKNRLVVFFFWKIYIFMLFKKKNSTWWFNVTFSYPSWRSLSLWKGHLTMPKRSLWITWYTTSKSHQLAKRSQNSTNSNCHPRPPMTMTFLSFASKVFGSVPWEKWRQKSSPKRDAEILGHSFLGGNSKWEFLNETNQQRIFRREIFGNHIEKTMVVNNPFLQESFYPWIRSSIGLCFWNC